MSIDTLCTKSGYRAAEYIDVARCVNAGHTEHLQTDRGVVAFRPYSESGHPARLNEPGILVEFYPAGRDRDGEIQRDFPQTEKNEIIAFVLECLNGSSNSYEPNDSVTVYANQADRDGYVLAVDGNDILIEYFMPNGSTALRQQRVIGVRYIGDYRSVSYRNVPKRWIRAIKDQGMTNWEGRQQGYRGRVPFPA